MRFLSADFVFPISSPAIPNGIVAVRNDGSIDGVYAAGRFSEKLTIEKHRGILCPGFVNAHCHLELSYLKGKIEPHTSLAGFIAGLLNEQTKNKEPDEIKNAAAEADKVMFEQGINCVGDISNGEISYEVKSKSAIAYHTFIELYDFLEERTEEVFEKGKKMYATFSELRKSLTPHATYSVTQKLLKKIFAFNSCTPVSIHHAESESERELMTEGTGKLAVFFQHYFKKDFRQKDGVSSVQSLLDCIQKEQPLLLVHNTYSTAEVVHQINGTGQKVFWCLCPKANLYIENRLPDIRLFQSLENCCLGTDSLASNDTLCVLEEMKTILRYYPEISTGKLLQWATLNGAKALMLENQFGSFEKNKKPGILLIEKTEGKKINQESRVKRLV
ncbi:MAG: amidohydrolase family protein [Bacteroidia bacterium]|nr:amidohydrolase family protein [Bacteroidia bacterium]